MTNRCPWLIPGFLKTPNQNGVGRYVGQMSRICFKYCKYSGSSRGLRDYLETELLQFAEENPGVAVYVKPRRHRGAVIVAEYLNDQRFWMCVSSLPKETILKWVDIMRTQVGDKRAFRFKKYNMTHHPSIQGIWTPYTFQDWSENLVTFPNAELSKAMRKTGTADKQLKELFTKQQQEKEFEENFEIESAFES